MKKMVPMFLAAALIAGSGTVAMAAAGAGADVNPHRVGRGADANPSARHNPAAGNTAASPARRGLSRRNNARWGGYHRHRYSNNYGYRDYRYGGWNGGYQGGWWNAPVGLSYGSGPVWSQPNECYEDLGYGRYESCDW